MPFDSLWISYFTWTIRLSDLVISSTLIFTAFVVIAVEDAKRPNVTIRTSTAIPFFIFFHILKHKLHWVTWNWDSISDRKIGNFAFSQNRPCPKNWNVHRKLRSPSVFKDPSECLAMKKNSINHHIQALNYKKLRFVMLEFFINL